MSLYFALQTVEKNKNKKSVKFQGDILNFCDFIQVFVFTTNHHLKKSDFFYTIWDFHEHVSWQTHFTEEDGRMMLYDT